MPNRAYLLPAVFRTVSLGTVLYDDESMFLSYSIYAVHIRWMPKEVNGNNCFRPLRHVAGQIFRIKAVASRLNI